MAAPFLARMAVRDVHLDDRERHGLDAVVQRDAELREARRVEDGPRHLAHVLVEGIDQHALVVRLHEDELHLDFRRERAQALVQLLERRRAVNVRLARPEQVEVRAVQHQDLLRRVVSQHSSSSPGWRSAPG